MGFGTPSDVSGVNVSPAAVSSGFSRARLHVSGGRVHAIPPRLRHVTIVHMETEYLDDRRWECWIGFGATMIDSTTPAGKGRFLLS